MTETTQGGPVPPKTGEANGDFKNPGGETGPVKKEPSFNKKTQGKDDGLPGHAWKPKKG